MHPTITTRVNYTVVKAPLHCIQASMRMDGHTDVGNGVDKYMVDHAMKVAKRFPSECRVWKSHNLVPLQLREQLATLIAGTTVPATFKANYMALGNSATPPANSDTQLGNETLRGTLTNRYAEGNVAYLDKFFSSAEVGGNTYLEAGVFVDGTGTANSGYLLSHIAIDETLGIAESLTFNITITIA